MFNVFSQTGLPGFRVSPQDDVPGFNVDENGLPQREGAWSDGTNAGSATPQQVTPVNCTTVSGSLDCTSPGGESFSGVRASPGFPQQLDSTTEDKHAYSVPDGPYQDSARTMRQDMINFPTPGPTKLVRPATPEGTLNEATPALQPIDHAVADGPVGLAAHRAVWKDDQSCQVLSEDRPEWQADRGQRDGTRPHAASWLCRALRHPVRRGADHPERRRGVGNSAGIVLSAHASSGLDKQRLGGPLLAPFE